MAIQSFADSATEHFFKTGVCQKGTGWANIKSVVGRKLDMVNAAATLTDLKAPPNNQLEALKHDLAGYHSIRVSGKWRLVFKWVDGKGPSEVRVMDYH